MDAHATPPTPAGPPVSDPPRVRPDGDGTGLSRRVAMTGLGGAAALLAVAACSPGERTSSEAPNPNQVPPPLSGDPGRTIQSERARIDQLDAQIADLLAQRAIASQNVQIAREQAGGPRLDPAREQQVITRYRDRLGPAGEQIARAILDADRGAGASSTPMTTTPTS
jgi:monofunctional chorismate mutase